MRFAIAGQFFSRYRGHMGCNGHCDLKHLAGLLAAAASLTACERPTTTDVQYDEKGRGLDNARSHKRPTAKNAMAYHWPNIMTAPPDRAPIVRAPRQRIICLTDGNMCLSGQCEAQGGTLEPGQHTK
jgi:hypothetical protein